MNLLSRKDRLIANEVIFRDVNKNIKEFIEENDPKAKLILFYCECSSPDCVERIELTAKDYDELHKNKKRFVILNGHEFPEVEKIIFKDSQYQIVEKHFEPPKAKDINLALKSIASKA